MVRRPWSSVVTVMLPVHTPVLHLHEDGQTARRRQEAPHLDDRPRGSGFSPRRNACEGSLLNGRPPANTMMMVQLARCGCVQHVQNVINIGTGKNHITLGPGLATCQRGISTGFTDVPGPRNVEARYERHLLNLPRQPSRLNLLISDELGLVPLSPTGAELLFGVFIQPYERGSILVTTNLPFDE